MVVIPLMPLPQHIFLYLFSLLCFLLVPPFLVGTIRKTKSQLQSRIGAPVWQPVLDMIKLLRKQETMSGTTTWIFRFSAAILVSIAVILAIMSPWMAPKVTFGPCDIFVIVYLLAAFRFFTLLLSLDTASPFGTFAASREATLSILVEPAIVLSLASLAVQAHTSDLNVVFSQIGPGNAILFAMSGSALLLASLVDLSRMPIDDPTTHLELTMVHEALILESSGKNLALIELAGWLKLSIMLGLSCQCFLHAFPRIQNPILGGCTSLAALALLAIALGTFESLSVKLHWRKTPEFIAYALTLAFAAAFAALGVGTL
jgi:formate hydrogenlyase subunit 4